MKSLEDVRVELVGVKYNQPIGWANLDNSEEHQSNSWRFCNN